MERNIRDAINRLGIALALLPTVFGTLAHAGYYTQIMVTNCPSSHHYVKVFAYNSGDTPREPTSTSKIHSGEGKYVHCFSAQCKLVFQTGHDTKDNTTGDAGYYVYIKNNDNVGATGPNYNGVCN